jgi:hypothetical protein
MQRQHEDKKQELERREKHIEEWGFQNEETKKIFEARMMK